MTQKNKDLIIITTVIVLSATIFLSHIFIHLDIEEGMLYAIALLLTLFSGKIAYTYYTAITGTILTILGFFLFYNDHGNNVYTINHFLSISMIWITTILITLSKKSNNAIQYEKNLNNTLLESARALFVVLDQKGRIIRFNKACEETTQYTFKDVKDRYVWDFLLIPEEREPVKNVFRELKENSLPNDFTNYWIAKDHSKHLIAWNNNIILDNMGQVEYVVSVGVDITESEQSKHRLKENEERISLFMNSATDAFILFDKDFCLLEINDMAMKSFKLDRESMIGMSMFDIYPHVKNTDRYEKYLQVIETGNPIVEEDVYILPERGNKYVSIKAFKVGKGLGFIATDITQIKQAQIAIQESQERLSLFMNSATDLFMLFDKDLNLLEINDIALRAIKQQRDNVIGKHILEINPHLSKTDRYGEYLQVLQTGKPLFKEDIGTHSDYDNRYISVRAFKAGEGLGITATDITETRQIRQSLQESENKYRQLVENMNDGLGVINSKGFITYVNDKLSEMTGYSKEELTSMHSFELFDEKNQIILKENLSMRKDGVFKSYEIVWTKKNGDKLYTILSPQPLYNAEGKHDGSFAVITNISELKNFEIALKRNKDYLEKLNNSVGLAIFTVKMPERVIDYANHQIEKIFGYTPEEMIGQQTRLLYPSNEDFISFGKKLQDTIQQGKDILHTEHILKRKNDESFPAEITTTFIRENGEITQVISIIQDITNRKMVEKNLLIMQSAVEMAVDPFIFGDFNGNITYCNESFLKLWGYDMKSEVLGKNASNFWNYHQNPDEIGNSLMKQGSWVGEIPCSHRDGTIFTARMASKILNDKNGQPICLMASLSDLTERIRAQQKAISALELNEKIISESPIGIAIYNSLGQCITANQAMADMVGATLENILKINYNNLDSWKKYGVYDTALEACNLNQKVRKEFDVITSFNKKVFLDCLFVPFLNHKEQHLLFMLDDITQRKESENLIRYHVHELEKANKELEEFNYVASHDLQEPIRTLSSYSTLLEKDLGDNLSEYAAQDIHFITDAAKRMRTVIQDMLDLSRASRYELNFVDVDLNHCMKNVIKDLELRINETNSIIEWDNLPIIHGDQTHLTRVLQNLIANAIKFRSDKTPHIIISAKKMNDNWKITVSDNGIGIEEKYFDVIFNAFKRLHPMGKYEGSGIGLAICRKIIERHGGEIHAESQMGHGTKFHFTLTPSTSKS